MVDLTQIPLATEEDKACKIDQWAKFFKSKDWSEVAMLAKENWSRSRESESNPTSQD